MPVDVETIPVRSGEDFDHQSVICENKSRAWARVPLRCASSLLVPLT